jgi:hypothetical protein
MNQIDLMARRNKSERDVKTAELFALESVLGFLDQLNIESYPLLRLMGSMTDALSHQHTREGRRNVADGQKELRAYALAAVELLEKGGMPRGKAEREIERRFEEAGHELAASTLRHWCEDFAGETDDAKRLQAILKAYTPGAIPGPFLGEKPAHWQAAGVVLRELDLILRLE